MSVPAKDWNNRLKDFLSGLAGFVPEIGGILKFLMQQFWPTSETDIFELMLQEITDLIHAIVDAEILKNEYAERKSELDGLKDSMAQYLKAGDHEKGSLMSAMLVPSNTLFEELDHSLNDVHLLPIAIIHAYQHLALLLERVKHGKEIYEEDNTKVWEAELEERVRKYQDYFVRKKQKWDEWRSGQITENFYTKRPGPVSPPDSYCDINDKVSGKHWQYFGESQSNPKCLKPGVDMLKQRVFSEINSAFVKSVYLRAFELGNFIPGHEHDQPVAYQSVGILDLGPFSVASSDGDHDYDDFLSFSGDMSSDTPGKITQVDVRAFNSIDGSQMHYRGHDGTFVGSPGGGAPHTFKIANEVVVNFFHMLFAMGLLAEVQYKASDKTDSGMLGNGSGWNMRYKVDMETSQLLDENFVLQGINMQAGAGPSSTTGVAVVLLTY